MPVALNVPAIKLSFSGTSGGGEIWQTGYWVTTSVTSPTQADLDTYLQSVSNSWLTAWNVIKVGVSASRNWTACQAHYYPANSIASTLASLHPVTPVVGTSSSPHPYQVAVVASLRSTVPTRSGRGRMYLPMDGISMSLNGQVAAGQPPSISGAIAAHLTAVNGIALQTGASQAVVVASHTTGNVLPVKNVVVDSIPDVQRRRTNRMVAVTVSTSAV